MSTGLERCTGPECPRCGCRDSVVVRSSGRWRAPEIERRHCKNCDFEWREKKWAKFEPVEPSNGDGEEETGAVVFHVLRCPACQSEKTKVTSSPNLSQRLHMTQGFGVRPRLYSAVK